MAPIAIQADPDAIFALIKARGHTPTTFARDVLGISPQFLWNVRSGNHPRLSIDRAERIVAGLNRCAPENARPVTVADITLAGEAGKKAA